MTDDFDNTPEGEQALEGMAGMEGELLTPKPKRRRRKLGSNLSTKRQKSMLKLLELANDRTKEPDFDSKLLNSLHKLDDFAPCPTRYARQQRITLMIRRAGKPEVKKTLSGYLLFEHRDQYDTWLQGKRLLVESDKTSFVIIGHYIDQKNLIGRNLRKANAEPITSLADTLGDVLGLEVLLEPPDKD